MRAPKPRPNHEFLKRHASDFWAWDFFCFRTVLFQTLHVFFVIQHVNREILHVEVTRHSTGEQRSELWNAAPSQRTPPWVRTRFMTCSLP
jgi:hypothetical protein